MALCLREPGAADGLFHDRLPAAYEAPDEVDISTRSRSLTFRWPALQAQKSAQRALGSLKIWMTLLYRLESGFWQKRRC